MEPAFSYATTKIYWIQKNRHSCNFRFFRYVIITIKVLYHFRRCFGFIFGFVKLTAFEYQSPLFILAREYSNQSDPYLSFPHGFARCSLSGIWAGRIPQEHTVSEFVFIKVFSLLVLLPLPMRVTGQELLLFRVEEADYTALVE